MTLRLLDHSACQLLSLTRGHIPYLHFESSMHHDLVAVLMNDRSPPEPMPLPREQSRAGTTLTNPSTLPQSADPEATHSVPLGSGVSGTHQDHVQHPDESSRAGGPEQPLVQRAQEEPPPDQSQPPTLRVIDAIHPYVHLIKGYFSQEKPGDVPRWQPRRSLDGYFYTHLADIRRRDGDQVILRYTTNNCPPARIFVVDQLWVWILGSETIITCSPLTYDSWIWDAHGQATRSGNMRVVAPEDPMNLHQNIIRHLKRGDREPITSVHDLACLIADTCTKLFDQDETPDGFRFFDFFEHEIARLSEMAMLQLEEFKKSLGSARHSNQSGSKHIRKELSLLVEVHDICDELEILEKVLKDQDDALTRMKGILAPKSRWEWTGSWATGLHAQWLHRMLKMATRTRETLYHLLDLKLKQASFYEAMDTRKQAEATKQQTRLATEHSKVMAQQTQVAAEHSEVMAQQLETMKDQALETGRQGQTLLVFTVVTIIFLPSSFMAAVFSIDLDTFPVDGNDKMPLGYFLKYLFAISCAITIPLVVLAFNLTPMVAWWSRTRQRLIRLWPKDSRILWTGVIGPAIALAVEGAVVGAIWAAPLAVSIKAAVTISISLLVALAIGVLVLYAVNSITKRHRRSLQTGSGSSYVGSMLGDTRDILVVEEQREAADFEHRQH
ncbi:hypothetical protein N657DRAFT_483660 [Parathielavia appendiculata]|uniref:Ankyrin repeat protein n=1 Tax=Parathielavia appendiculata TaxID=2587402 RepID=A0AAN6TZ95_9PEZI|nr:hypothetical protein N657DRAFT_483660 [Parathielavia appendiculata]